MHGLGSCKGITAEDNTNNHLSVGINSPGAKHAFDLVGGNKILCRNNFSPLLIYGLAGILHKE